MLRLLSKLKNSLRGKPVGVALLMCCCYGASVAHTATIPFFQERIIKGRVTSADDGLGFPGVNILVKGTTVGSVTDADGNYSLPVSSSDAILVFSSIGYKTTEIP